MTKKTIDGHSGPGLVKLVGTNIAFSQTGLHALGINDNLQDDIFAAGQLADASKTFAQGGLSDPGTVTGTKTDPAWEPEFKQPIHVCVIITGDSLNTVRQRQSDLDRILLGTTKTVIRVDGAVRPGAGAGREHFGYQDGISEPAIIGFKSPNPGEDPTPAGVIILGGDTDRTDRPPWTKDGSFLAFRKLRQFVPEFNDFVAKNPIKDQGLSPQEGSDLLGARLVGRWKSGAPVVRNPLRDNPAEGKDKDTKKQFINNFNYDTDPAEVKCPFAAHLRKMNPRDSFPNTVQTRKRRISRQGIPYGPEVDTHETSHTMHDRGLLFVCYQSNLSLGFHFLQRNWADNPGFPNAGNGFDPLIGQNVNAPRFIAGTDPENVATSLALPNGLFVFPLGGEYFLSPSISALKTKIAA